jgi:hypothetical protein
MKQRILAASILSAIALAANAGAVTTKPNTISFTTFPSDTAYQTNKLSIAATATAGTPTFTVTGPATIASGLITLTGTGTVQVVAKEATAPTGYALPTPVTNSFVVSLASQTITAFAGISDQPYSTNAISITPPTASSGQAVTVTVKSGPATYSATTQKVTITGVGTVVLAANQAGVANKFSAADEVTTSFSVSQSSQTIAAFTAIPAKTWSPTLAAIVVTAPVATSRLPVTLSVVSGPGTISSNKVTATGAGTIVIAADQAGNANYTAATQVQTSIVVNKGSNAITAFAAATTPAAPKYGASFTIPVPTGKSTAPVIVTATGASVSQSGATATITPNAKGTVTVYANQAGDANWADANQVQKNVTVAAAVAVITPDSNKNLTFSSTVGTVKVTPTSTSSGAFTFSKTGTAGTVDPTTGVVTITGAGTLVVKATQAASTDGNYAAVTTPATVCTITIAKGVQTLNTPPSIPTPADGTSFYLPAATSDQGVALAYGVTGATYVSTTRKVTVTAAGTIGISASALANANYNALASTPVKSFSAKKKGSVYTFSSN